MVFHFRTANCFTEFIHTERTHVRNLKVLYQLFAKPLQLRQILPPETYALVFSNIDAVLDVHDKFNQQLKLLAGKWRTDNDGQMGDLGDAALEFFNNPRLHVIECTFCEHQQVHRYASVSTNLHNHLHCSTPWKCCERALARMLSWPNSSTMHRRMCSAENLH